ncbi:MAG: glycosyltransferase family 4 protein [Alphaproteobacteria bacterium]|nr:glycosyltransferase family 4 protein [Alphaproteobacteria bacterium]
MHILYFGFDVGGVGGIATYTRHQLRALRDLGHSVEVISVDKQEKVFNPGHADRHIPFAGRAGVVGALLGAVLLPRRQYNLVFTNHVYLAMFGRVARALRGTPYGFNVYNVDILTRLPALREYAFAQADLVIADCRYTIDNLPQFHTKVPPTGLLYDPVDTGFFRPIVKQEARCEVERRFGLSGLDSRVIAITVAHMAGPPNNNKGHRQTIEALKQLNDPRYLYLIVGAGPDRPAIEEHVRRHGVGEQVKFLGLVDQDALPFLYACADAAILVAKGGPGLGEAVPLGLIEASACGTAFVCGNEDGSVEAIDSTSPNGIAIDPSRADALAACLRRFADEPGLAESMGRNGIAMVDRVFKYERFVEQQGKLLQRLAGTG